MVDPNRFAAVRWGREIRYRCHEVKTFNARISPGFRSPVPPGLFNLESSSFSRSMGGFMGEQVTIRVSSSVPMSSLPTIPAANPNSPARV